VRPLIEAAARHPVFANLLMAVTLVGGVWGFSHMRAEVFPDVSTELVQISYPYPGASAEEVEQGVILRVEEALQGLDGIEDVLSVARENVATLDVELEEATPTRRREVVDEIQTRIDGITGLPDSVEEPTVRELVIELPAALFVLHGPAEERTLRELAHKLKDGLRAEGIAQVHLSGLREYEITIEVGEEELRARGLSLQDVARVVEASSLNLPAGSLRTRHEELKLEVRGRRLTGRDYEDLVVQASRDGTVVRLGEIATVTDGFQEDAILGRFAGERACLLQINATDGDDTIELAERAIAYAERFEGQVPQGVEVVVLGDFSRDIIDRINLLLGNGWQGLLLLFGCLVLMLNLRLSAWVAAGIPVAFALAGLLVYSAGHSLNMINLFGLILVLGIVVDDAIVVGENIYAKQEAGADPLTAAIVGATQVSWPVLAGVTTTIVAFTPLFFVDGVMGKFIEQMPLIVIATLIGSLVESLLILPNHLAHTNLRPSDDRSSLGSRIRAKLDAAFGATVARGYLPLFKASLRHRFTTVALAVAALMACGGLIAGDVVAFVMLPKEDSVYTQVDLTFPAGTPFSVTAAAVAHLEEVARQVDQELGQGEPGPFVGIYAEAGSGGQEHVGRLIAALRPSEQRTLHSEQIMAAWRDAAGPISGALQVRFGQFGGLWSKDIELKVRGDDADIVRAAASELVEAVANQPGTLDASSDYLPGKRELRVRLTELGRIQGITVASLAAQVRAAFYGDEALAVQRGRDEVEVQVRYPKAARASRADVQEMWVRGPTGAAFPFVEVADVELVPGLAEIHRRNGQRELTVSASVDEDATTASRVSAALGAADLPLVASRYPQVTIEVKGAASESAETLTSLVRGFAAAGLGMFTILALVFRSYLQPLLIMAVIPFGFVGAVLAHLLAGMPLTMLSVFGLVALAGVVVNDSLVLIDRINELLRGGAQVEEALHLAGPTRFRPILLTTITTVAGLFPLLFERSFQAQFVIPMAVSLAGGLAAATLGTLFVIPSLYLMLNDMRRVARWLRTGRWPTREDVEPACRQARRRDDPTPPSPREGSPPAVVSSGAST
jgi:multidrug efflux pump subunit AcrB